MSGCYYVNGLEGPSKKSKIATLKYNEQKGASFAPPNVTKTARGTPFKKSNLSIEVVEKVVLDSGRYHHMHTQACIHVGVYGLTRACARTNTYANDLKMLCASHPHPLHCYTYLGHVSYGVRHAGTANGPKSL